MVMCISTVFSLIWRAAAISLLVLCSKRLMVKTRCRIGGMLEIEGTGVLPALRFGSRLGAVLHDVLLIDIPDHVVLAVVEEGMLGSREEIAESRLLITETVPVFPQAYKGLLHNLLGEVRIPAG